MPLRLNWAEIDSDSRFHDLVNEWLLSRLNSWRFHPGDPRGGPDGGWDGSYSGALWLEPSLPAGRWMCQAKYTKKTFKTAATWLRDELLGKKGRTPKKGEIAKAIDARVDYLLVITQAPIRSDDVEKLRELDSSRTLKAIVVLCRQNLDALLVQHRWLCARYFGSPEIPGLVPEWEYANRLAALPGSDFPFVGRVEQVDELKAAISSHRCTVVHGASGMGKTRLIREAAARATDVFSACPFHFYNTARGAAETIQDELNRESDCIVVLDDADRSYDVTTRLFVRFVLRPDCPIKLVLICSEGSRPSLVGRLAQDGVFDLAEVAVNPLAASSVETLIALNVASITGGDKARLVRAAGGNPLLLGFALQSISAGHPPFNFATNYLVRAHLANRIVQGAVDALTGTSVSVGRLLASLACMMPFRQGGTDSQTLAGLQQSDMTPAKVSSYLDKLVQAKILREVGETYRFYPDIFGDIVLAAHLAGVDAKAFRDAIIAPLLADDPERLVVNVLNASLDSAASAILSEILDQWIREERDPTHRRGERLKASAFIAHVHPRGVLDLIDVILSFPVPEHELSDNRSSEEIWSGIAQGIPVFHRLSTNDFGPPLEVAGRHPDCVARALSIVPRLKTVRLGHYSNYHPEQLVEHWHSPVDVPLATIAAGLAACARMIGSGNDDDEAIIAVAASRTVLRVAWSYTTGDSHGFVLGAVPGQATPEVLALRSTALACLQEGLAHSRPSVRMHAASAAEKIGEDSYLPYAKGAPPLQQQAVSERRQIYIDIGRLFPAEQHLGVLYRMSDTLLQSWLQQRACCDVAETVLRSLSWEPELQAYRWAVDYANGIDSLHDIMDAAPQADRWHWWVQRSTDLLNDNKIESLIVRHLTLVKKLDERNPGLQGFLSLLNKLADGVADDLRPQWFFAFQTCRPDYFDCLWRVENSASVPSIFRKYLRTVWAWMTPGSFARFRATYSSDLATESGDVIYALLDVTRVAPDAPSGRELGTLLNTLATHGSADVRRHICEATSWWPGISTQDRVNILCTCLCVEIDDQIVRSLSTVIEHNAKRETINRSPVRDVVLRHASSTSQLERRAFGSLVALSADSLSSYVELIEKSFEKGISVFDIEGPRRNTAGKTLVQSVSDLRMLIEYALSWRSRGLLSRGADSRFVQELGRKHPSEAAAFAQQVEVTQTEFDAAIDLLAKVPFERCEDAWLHLAGEAHGVGGERWLRAAKAFENAAGFVGEYSWLGGADPAELTQRIQSLERLARESRNAFLAPLIRGAKSVVDEQLIRFRKQRESDNDPR